MWCGVARTSTHKTSHTSCKTIQAWGAAHDVGGGPRLVIGLPHTNSARYLYRAPAAALRCGVEKHQVCVFSAQAMHGMAQRHAGITWGLPTISKGFPTQPAKVFVPRPLRRSCEVLRNTRLSKHNARAGIPVDAHFSSLPLPIMKYSRICAPPWWS